MTIDVVPLLFEPEIFRCFFFGGHDGLVGIVLPRTPEVQVFVVIQLSLLGSDGLHYLSVDLFTWYGSLPFVLRGIGM